MSWEHKDCWKSYGTDFLVEVTRHKITPLDHYEGPNGWAVYAYIYPKHPRFSKFESKKIWQHATNDLPLHWGCSYIHSHRDDEGKITSWQIGADYHHLHDQHFTRMGSKDDATEVFSDAEELFKILQAESCPTPTRAVAANLI